MNASDFEPARSREVATKGDAEPGLASDHLHDCDRWRTPEPASHERSSHVRAHRPDVGSLAVSMASNTPACESSRAAPASLPRPGSPVLYDPSRPDTRLCIGPGCLLYVHVKQTWVRAAGRYGAKAEYTGMKFMAMRKLLKKTKIRRGWEAGVEGIMKLSESCFPPKPWRECKVGGYLADMFYEKVCSSESR